ncbi:MAG: amino acid adenylation domain-containing protein [Firmicutes bacterium]|nr:amino acid adenylation domain-containing protein [Bacillota bacterium]
MINILEYLENTPNPDKTAFTGENSSLTFGQLQHLSRAVGSFLCKENIYKQPVAVFMAKSPEMIAAFFGVVYGGNYYVPLDTEMPEVRIRMILEKIAQQELLVICDNTTEELVKKWGYKACNFAEISCCPVNDTVLAKVRRRATDIDPVYVVFTSGSTGVPKGVVASHRAVIDYVDTLCQVLQIDENTVFGNQSPLYLDACLKELFPTLKYGASTFLIPKSLFMFPIKLVEYIIQNRINTVCWVASAFSLVAGLGTLDKAVPETIKTIAFGSEIFPQKHLAAWRKALPGARFVHLYGPTEATGMSAFYVVDRDFDTNEPIPIGKPFPNRGIVLLDDNGKVPTPGEPGEIHIRGSQLSLGYYGDEELIRKAFVQNPLSPFPDILYKTGDLGYENPNGDLVFISRKDHQIKHMGHRIELAEIEVAAREMDGVEMVCAIFDSEKSRIILFFTATDGIEKSHVLAHLKVNLPRYMVPQQIHKLESLPLTPGGKIDRVALKERI